jgi:hypothetical protein
MNILPVSPDKLTLNELRSFKDFHKLMTSDISGPEGFQYYMQCFLFLHFFAIACIVENRFPPLSKCWKELESLFMKDPIFEDGLFFQSWIFFNLPINNGNTLLDEFENFQKEINKHLFFEQFILAMKGSRLGLYQEVLSTKTVTKFKEFFTDQVVSTIRSVPDYSHGEIFLARIVEYKGEFFLFGDPKCWPSAYKDQIIGMVKNKFYFFNNLKSNIKNYEQFMKLAGPYWFSCVSTNTDIDILDPDHYLTYHENEN